MPHVSEFRTATQLLVRRSDGAEGRQPRSCGEPAGTPLALTRGMPGTRPPTRARAFVTTCAAFAALLAATGCEPSSAAQADALTAPVSSIPAVRVRVAAATWGTLDNATAATGRLHPFKTATVAAEAPGRIRRRRIERGEAISKGAVLYDIDGSRPRMQYDLARANEEAADLDLDLAKRELGRADRLIDAHDISRSRYDEIEHRRDAAAKRRELAGIDRALAKRAMTDTRARSPFQGTAVRIHAEVGDYVGPGTPLVTIADLDRVRLRVGLTAAEADALGRELDPDAPLQVPVRFDELGGLTVPGSLHDVSALADPATGTYAAEFWLDQPPRRPLREGMVGRLDLSGQERTRQLLIPRPAVVRHGRGFAVWVVVREGGEAVAQRRPVSLGRWDTNRTEVREGLTEGDLVVVEGAFALAENQPVEVDGEEG